MQRMELEVLALVIDLMHLGGIREYARLLVITDGVILPATFPELVHERHVVLGDVVAGVVSRLPGPAGGPCRTVEITGHHVPGDSTFGEVIESFRRLTGAERSSIKVTRLRLRQTRGGENPESFGSRTGSSWTPEQTAVFNSLPLGASLPDGRLLKVALREPYKGR